MHFGFDLKLHARVQLTMISKCNNFNFFSFCCANTKGPRNHFCFANFFLILEQQQNYNTLFCLMLHNSNACKRRQQ